MSTITKPDITPGTWAFDPSHSEIGFSVRHLMVSKVKGRFGDVRRLDLDRRAAARVLGERVGRHVIDRHPRREPRRSSALAGLLRDRQVPAR